MRQHLFFFPHRKTSTVILAAAGVFCLFSIGVSMFVLTFANKIVPNILIDNIAVGGMTQAQAVKTLWQVYEGASVAPEISLSATISGTLLQTSTSSASLGFHRDIDAQVHQAFLVGRSGSLKRNIVEVVGAWRNKRTFSTRSLLDTSLVKTWIADTAKQWDKKGEKPFAGIGSKGLFVDAGKEDWFIHQDDVYTQITEADISQTYMFSAPVLQSIHVLTNEEVIQAQKRASLFAYKQTVVTTDNLQLSITGAQFLSLLSFPDGYDVDTVDALIEQWREKIDRPAKNPELKIENNTVLAFTPPENGLTVNKRTASDLILNLLKTIDQNEKLAESYALSTQITPPSTLLSDTNKLGINERIGIGESLFFHSIPNRVHNVELTARRLNNALIAPGETLSFNNTVGEVSRKTGYLQAYVISQGKTVLGDGGGVCQVSTTLFRSALNAGLPITERHGHSYRVGYYEENSKAGFDATVYAPSVDLKITNDTPGHLLVRTITDVENRHLTVELWGSFDGRKAEITDWKMWGQSPALPTRYQDDPTLPPGTLKQVDFSAPGAKTSFQYRVMRDGVTLIDQKFTTVYRPWAAVYLRGI